MFLRLLILSIVYTSLSAGEANLGQDFIKEVSKVIFRNIPEKKLKKEKLEFQATYPHEIALDTTRDTEVELHITSRDIFDRGYASSVRDTFFLGFLGFIAKIVDLKKTEPSHNSTSSLITVADFGCGNGATSFLLALTGAHTFGIESRMSDRQGEEMMQRYHDYCDLAQKIGLPCLDGHYLPIRIMPSTDVTDVPAMHERLDSNDFDAIFMGNFLHMFDPYTAKSVVQNQAHRMLKQGGMVWASVDGIAAEKHSENGANVASTNIKEVYLKAKADGKAFPTVMTRTDLRLVINNRPIIIDQKEILSSANVDEEGRTEFPCRNLIFKNFFLCEPPKASVELKNFVLAQQTFCSFDFALINFVFPSSQWQVQIRKVDANAIENPELTDEDTAQWRIFAMKK